MPLWKKLWILFTVIWVIVAALNAGTILAFSDEPEKAVQPTIIGLVVPAVVYLILLAWQRLGRKPTE